MLQVATLQDLLLWICLQELAPNTTVNLNWEVRSATCRDQRVCDLDVHNLQEQQYREHAATQAWQLVS